MGKLPALRAPLRGVYIFKNDPHKTLLTSLYKAWVIIIDEKTKLPALKEEENKKKKVREEERDLCEVTTF